MDYTIAREWNEKTVKEYLRRKLCLSGKMITRLKQREHGILLNGIRVTVRAIMNEGDILTLATEQEDLISDKIQPVDIPLHIIYEDEYYMIIDKPANMPTHPSHDHYDDTLANGIAHLYQIRGIQFVCRAVNRLDRDTSGIVIFAKSAIAANEFSRLQQNKLVKKEYIALVEGIVSHPGSIKGYIRRKADSIMLREFLEKNEKQDASYSHTDYFPIKSSANNTLISLLLHTGRTHQIRVHMAHIGHPVTGDGLYGSEGTYTRHFLHAHKISFPHPFTGIQTSFIADLPADFIAAITEKGIEYDTYRNN